MKKYCLLTFIFLIFGICAKAQAISVIHIQGDAYAYSNAGEKEVYSKLVYGPLKNSSKIIVKEKSSVKLVGEDNQICELTEEGTYPISDLNFAKVKSNTIFDKFCDYFHSFFVSHASSESKSNYRNNIYAISRGNTPPPSLDFPLSGIVPIDAGSLPFIWTHACDSCEYIFTVNDYKTREIVYTIMTKDHKVEIENSVKYFVPNHRYYWSVKIVGMDMEYENIPFTMSENGAYSANIDSIEKELSKDISGLAPAARMIYTMSELDAIGQENYALLYGLKLQKSNPNDASIADLFERYWYDILLEK